MGFERVAIAATAVLSMTVAAVVSIDSTSAQALPEYTSQEFVDLYDQLSLPNISPIIAAPEITGDAGADARIRALAEFRGYRLRTQAGAGLVAVSGQEMQPAAAAAWTEMSAAAAADGISMTVTSGYRSADEQRVILIARLSGWRNDQIASGAVDAAIEDALRLVSVPGYSKHHSGYAIDIAHAGGGLGGFEQTPSYGWLSADNFANAKRFGFVPSYPYFAAALGPDPEPWEFVWVGTDSIASMGTDWSPEGRLERASFDSGGVTVLGWALDRDTADAVVVRVYADDKYLGAVGADLERPDVAAALGEGANRGFRARFALGPGPHTVCVRATSAGPAPHAALGCVTG